MVYFNSYIDCISIQEELLFVKCLELKTTREEIFNFVKKYLQEKQIPFKNIIQVASDSAAAMLGKNKGFVSRLKELIPGIIHIHCIIHRQHLAAKVIGGDMEDALDLAITIINFINATSLNHRQFSGFCDDAEFKTLLLHAEVRWLSKGNSLERLVILWKQVIEFLMFESQDTETGKNNVEKHHFF